MLTGISGSNTVEIASTIRAELGVPRGSFAAVVRIETSAPGRARRARLGPGMLLALRLMGLRLHSVDASSIASRLSAALSVCQARLAHFTRTGNSRTPAKHRQLAEVRRRRAVRRRS